MGGGISKKENFFFMRSFNYCKNVAEEVVENYLDSIGGLEELIHHAFGMHPDFLGMNESDIFCELVERVIDDVEESLVIEESMCLELWNIDYSKFCVVADTKLLSEEELKEFTNIIKQCPIHREEKENALGSLSDGELLCAYNFLCNALEDEDIHAFIFSYFNNYDSVFSETISLLVDTLGQYIDEEGVIRKSEEYTQNEDYDYDEGFGELEESKKSMWKNNNLLRETGKNDFITSYFLCGPGQVNAYYTNDYENNELEEFEGYDTDLAREIEGFIFNEGWNDDLANAYNGEGVESITFEEMVNHEGGFYMMWKVVWSPKIVGDIEKIKDFLEGQMSDGWGESFEQHEFFKENDYITDEFEDYNDLDEYGDPITKMMYNVKTEITYYYSPWSDWGYEVIEVKLRNPYGEKVKRHRRRV